MKKQNVSKLENIKMKNDNKLGVNVNNNILSIINDINETIKCPVSINKLNESLEKISYDNIETKIMDSKVSLPDKTIVLLKHYKNIFIGMYSLYGLFMLISFIYLLFPRKTISITGKNIFLLILLYYPYLLLSFILLIYNLCISGSLLYFNNKELPLSNINLSMFIIKKIRVSIEKGGIMFITGTILFLLLKTYLFFRIFF